MVPTAGPSSPNLDIPNAGAIGCSTPTEGCGFSQQTLSSGSHNAFSPGTQTQSQASIGAFEGHLSYDVKRRLWFSLDGNFLGRRSDQLEWDRKREYSSEKLPHRRNSLNPLDQAPKSEI